MHVLPWRVRITGSGALALAAAVALAGCTKEAPPPPAPAPVETKPAPAPAPAAPGSESAPSEDAEGPTACAAPISEKSRLALDGKDADGQLVLGVLGPINEDSKQNLANLDRYVKFFQAEKADAIVVTGDVGEVASGITKVIEKLADSKLPVLVTIGNRECQADFADGIAAAQKTHPNVVNLVQTRVVDFPGGAVISLPGYHDANYINCTTGCRYSKENLDELVKYGKDAKKPLVLVSHGPPKGEGSQALDYAASGGNVGDPALNQAIASGKLHFGVFSNIKEAGQRATDESLNTMVAAGTRSKSLFLNPGAADSTRWEMNDRTKSYGSAAVLVISGDEASWKGYRAPAPPPEAPKKKGRK